MRLGRSLSDEELLAAFEGCALPKERFHHSDHIRLAWRHTGRYGPADAETRFLSGIQRLATQFGVPENFHHTVTVAWMRLVSARYQAPNANVQGLYSEWIARNRDLLDRELLSRLYSKQALDASSARYGWREPDLQALPDAPKRYGPVVS